MDQNAFRSLLSAPRSAGESSKRVLGAPAPKRGWTGKSKSGKEYEKKVEPKDDGPMMAPRAHQKKVAQGKYKDRAEMRRKGVDDEYKPVEKLLEDFEQRARDAGDDQEEVNKARQYLGGDAEHSILVKGLDYSLLAARKAELARQKEDVADDELDALLGGEKVKVPEVVKPKHEEAVVKGFRSIAQKEEEKPKKKKKKKKVKAEAEVAAAPPADKITMGKSPSAQTNGKVEIPAPEPVPKAESEPDVDDIFGDAGEYDLNAGRVDDDSSDESDVGSVQAQDKAPQARDTRSRSIDSDGPRRRRYSSSSAEYMDRRRDSRDRGRKRDDSAERYDRRDRSQEYRERRESDYGRRRERSDSTDRYWRGRSESRERIYRQNSRERYRRDRSDSRERYRRDRSDSRGRYDRDRREHRPHYRDDLDRNGYGSGDRYRDDRRFRRSPRQSKRYSRSPSPVPRSPKRRRHSPSRSPPRDPPPRRSRSPSPLFDPYAMQSRSPSPSSDEGPFTGKLKPLASSAIADVKGFLSADADAAKAEEKRAKKAAWRARQGLGPQEGTEDLLKKDMNEKQKFNRDYVVLMNKMKKDEEKS